MKAIQLTGDIDEQHRLRRGTQRAAESRSREAGRARADVPLDLPVLIPEEDEVGQVWSQSVAGEWSAELGDVGEDIYSMSDGQPVNEYR